MLFFEFTKFKLHLRNLKVLKSEKSILAIGVLAIGYVVFTNYNRLNIISGYSAKNMSSSVFLAGRSLETTDTQDNNFSPIDLAKSEVDYKNKLASASVYGFMKRKAIYKEGLGSILMNDDVHNLEFLIVQNQQTTYLIRLAMGQ